MKRKGLIILGIFLVLIIAVSPFLASCTKPATTTAPAPATTAAPAPVAKTLKIGVVAWLGWPLGIDMVHGIEILADLENKKGGLSIGGEKYTIQPIVYDTNNSQTTAVAAVNRLIFEDKVKFIIADSFFVDAWLPITEQNKVVVCAGTPSPGILNPNNRYAFETGFLNSQVLQMSAWFGKNFPDKKNVVVGLPDTQDGHNYEAVYKAAHAPFNINVTSVFYPASSQDLSAMGTKVKTLNPDAFEATGGGPVSDGLAFKAVWQAGYRGILYANGTVPGLSLKAILPAEAVEGFINGAWAVEFDPALTQIAKDFKAAYIAKYGKWDGPEVMFTANWACLKDALQKAGSLDSDKVAAAIASGLKFEGPTGPAQMASRPDVGASGTIDSVSTYYVKKMINGEPVLIDTVKIDDAVANFNNIYK